MEEMLQQLLRHATGDRGDGWRSGTSSQIVEALNSGDEMRQLQATEELCMELNMATPITLTMINTSGIVPPLLGCLRKEHNPELQLLVARALTYMADSLPRTLEILSSGNNVEALLEPVASIQDVELAEQCLSCIEKLTQTSSGAAATFRCNGIGTMLAFVDFFTSNTQRKIWTSISRMCKCVDCGSFSNVVDALPAMRSSIHSSDEKIRSHALYALHRLVSGVRKDPRLVDQVFGELPDTLSAIITNPESEESTFSIALSLIQAAVSFSDVAVRLVIESGLLTGLLNLLDGTAAVATVPQDAMDVASPEDLTDPARNATAENNSSMARAPATAPVVTKRHALTFESSKVLCSIFTIMIVPDRDGPFAYIQDLVQLELQEAAAALANPVGAGNATEPELEGEDEDEEDYEDVSEENEEDEADHEELRERIRSTPGLSLKQNVEFMRLRDMTHICDGCNKTCALGDWYRCNDCRDADFCGQCLLDAHASHGEGKHSFCDMKALHEATPAQPKEYSDIESVVLALYRVRPDLLAELLRAVPKVVVLCTQSDSAVIRTSGMNFLLSAATRASPELLRGAGMKGADVCEAILAALTDSSVLLNITGVVLTSRLLEKFPNDYADTLVREGVASALLLLQQRNKSSVSTFSRSSPVHGPAVPPGVAPGTQLGGTSPTKPPLQKKIQSLDGWRGIVSEEIEAVFSRVPVLRKKTTSPKLDELVALLRKDDLRGAAQVLRDVLRSHTTAFEFAAQSVFHEIKECLVRHTDNIDDVLAAIYALCEDGSGGGVKDATRGAAASSSLLAEFVHLLQTALSHLDDFAPPSFGAIRSIHSRLPLEVVPHKPDVSHLSSFPRGPILSASEESEKKDRKNKREKKGKTDKKGKKKEEPESEPNDDAGEGPSARVNIEPLANVYAISAFIARTLLPQSRNPRAMTGGARQAAADEDGDNRIEDVLPELGQSGEPGKPKAKKSKKEETPEVWLRYENHILPLSMTMIQLMQTLVRCKGKPHDGSSLSAGGIGVTKPIRLYYSTKPFGAPYEMAHTFKEIPNELKSGVCVLPPSKEARPDAVTRVLAQIRQPFGYSRSYLSEAQMDILTLLGVLHEVVTNWSALLQYSGKGGAPTTEEEETGELWSPAVSRGDFVHRKLNNKAMRHCSSLLLAGQHTNTWAVNLALDCNFLFAPSTRKFMFEVSFCGTVRSLARMQQNLARYGVRDSASVDHTSSRNIQLTRGKKRVWRDYPLECAIELLGGERTSGGGAWEFEFYGEAGSGLGPTREFYTLVAKALRERSRKLWRPSTEGADDKYFAPLNGLYPRPLSAAATASQKERESMTAYFKFMGRFVGRALLDEHVASLPLSPVFLKMLRGDTCGVHDLRLISESLCDVLLAMVSASAKNTDMIQLPGQKKSFPVEAMSLQFTLPGDDTIELKDGGASLDVTKRNMLEYCDSVTTFLLSTGVSYAVSAFREGFNDYIPIMALHMLSVEEFFEVINGYTQPISREEFENNCSADHGFTLSCSHVQWLFDILADFSLEEQKRFFLFLTGSPHLPVGGLSSLRPKLTIVRKTSSEASVKETDQLPSAMTCQNYLKLPAYESKEQMEEKLRQAINEGTGAFLLS